MIFIKTILFVAILFFFIGCEPNYSVSIYLIPEGYEGPISIIEDQNSKSELVRRGDTTVFDFRNSLVLRFKGKFIQGSTTLENLQYYYVKADGSRERLNFALNISSNLDSSKSYVYLQHSRITGESLTDLISSPKNFLKNFKSMEKLFDSLFMIKP